MSLVVCENWWTETECPCRLYIIQAASGTCVCISFQCWLSGIVIFSSFNISHIHIIDYDQICLHSLSDSCPIYPLHITFPFQLHVLLKKKPTESTECCRSRMYGSWNILESVGCFFPEESWFLSQQPSISNCSSARGGTSGTFSSPYVVEWVLFLVENVF